jgi:hypothetical protein
VPDPNAEWYRDQQPERLRHADTNRYVLPDVQRAADHRHFDRSDKHGERDPAFVQFAGSHGQYRKHGRQQFGQFVWGVRFQQLTSRLPRKPSGFGLSSCIVHA